MNEINYFIKEDDEIALDKTPFLNKITPFKVLLFALMIVCLSVFPE